MTAPEGRLVYVADLSNIEARMLAWLAEEQDLLQAFARNDDVYSQFASQVYGRTINKHDDPTERFVGKTAILGLGYGMGANKFQTTLQSGAMGPQWSSQAKKHTGCQYIQNYIPGDSGVLVPCYQHVTMDYRQTEAWSQVSCIYN